MAAELQAHLSDLFHIAVHACSARNGLGYRVYQVAKSKIRHLADVGPSVPLPPVDRIDGILVVTPAELIAGKVISCVRRNGKPKSFTDRCDLARMLLRFPERKSVQGEVHERLEAQGASEEAMVFWRQLVAEEILPEEDEDEFS